MNGFLCVLKPPGMTSSDVVVRVRRRLPKGTKVGHAGTLDPEAAGVLPLMIGKASRLFDYLVEKEKVYIAELKPGYATDTQDAHGSIVAGSGEMASLEQLEAVLPQFLGEIMQTPSMFSALKRDGQKLCDLARKGQEVARKPRSITIYELELLEQVSETDYTFRCVCSKGTYIRTLCHDIGQVLGCGGTLYSLRRTMAAGFTLDESVTLEQVQEAGETLLRPADSLFREHPEYRLKTGKQEERCRNGNPFFIKETLPEGTYRIYGREGDFLCLSRLQGDTMTSLKNFFGA